MQQRIDVTKVSPAAFQAVAALQSYVDQSGLDPKLRELIKIRASQINGCAYCLAMHTRDARKHGETDERMHLLNAWRETPLYTDRERAALAWVEAVTLLTEGHVPDDVFDTVRKQFSEKEIVDLTAAVVAINTWNRLSIAFRVQPQLDTKKAAAALVAAGLTLVTSIRCCMRDLMMAAVTPASKIARKNAVSLTAS